MIQFNEAYRRESGFLLPEDVERLERAREDVDDELEFFGLTSEDLKGKRVLNCDSPSLSEYHRDLKLDVVTMMPPTENEETGEKNIHSETPPDFVYGDDEDVPFDSETFDLILDSAKSDRALLEKCALLKVGAELRVTAKGNRYEYGTSGALLEHLEAEIMEAKGDSIETKIYDLPNKHTRVTWPVLIIKRIK